LSSEDPGVFEGYLRWLCARGVDAKSGDNAHGHLARLYVLGEKLVDAKFQEAVLKELIKNVRELEKYPSTETIKIIYNGTTEGSPARHLLVDFYACRASAKWDGIKKMRQDTNDQFADDLL
jgi:hypothetical protein